MNFRIYFALGFILLSFQGCHSFHSELKAKQTMSLMPQAPAWGALYHQRAAEYRALCFQAYNYGRLALDEAIRQYKGKRPMAVVTDLDETVLDNSPYYVNQAIIGAGYSDSSWLRWSAKVACDSIPGAPSFFRYAHSRGIEVFYITNRLLAEQEFTLKNLKLLRMPNVDAKHLFMLTTTSSKNSRRAVVAKNYTILMFFGDNLGDFAGNYDNKSLKSRNQWVADNKTLFGKRYFILPNMMYGNWEESYYGGKPRKNWADSNSVLNGLMKGY